jgi:hypothetical protein
MDEYAKRYQVTNQTNRSMKAVAVKAEKAEKNSRDLLAWQAEKVEQGLEKSRQKAFNAELVLSAPTDGFDSTEACSADILNAMNENAYLTETDIDEDGDENQPQQATQFWAVRHGIDGVANFDRPSDLSPPPTINYKEGQRSYPMPPSLE